mmetsp:Transcript_15970/g.45927  ORF Transcript_15970/g.45927 Transcript_15970/m.45927 type:complete len:108 (-) Transcript_15970:1311-1634(-)
MSTGQESEGRAAQSTCRFGATHQQLTSGKMIWTVSSSTHLPFADMSWHPFLMSLFFLADSFCLDSKTPSKKASKRHLPCRQQKRNWLDIFLHCVCLWFHNERTSTEF